MSPENTQDNNMQDNTPESETGSTVNGAALPAGSDPTGPDGDIAPISIVEEMQRSYLDYAMSVIVARAVPDVRDGLKPVHRRILYGMKVGGYDWNRAYRKCDQ